MLGKADQDRIKKVVNFFLNSTFDREFIATEIIIRASLDGVPHVGRDHIKHRCFDAIRKRHRELKGNEQMVSMNMTTTEKKIEPSQYVEDVAARNELIEQLVFTLSPFERQIIWMRYYNNQTLDDMARDLKMRRDAIQKVLQLALYKMGQEAT